MLIEFTGLPGSGKTTIANKLIDRIGGEVDVKRGTFDHLGTMQRVGSKLASALSSFFIFPKYTFLIVKELFANHNRKVEAVRDTLNILYLMKRYHKASKEIDAIYIFDKGLIQAFLSSCMYGQWSDKVFEILKIYSDRVIFVDVSPKVSAQRLSERGDKNSRSQKQTDKIQHLVEQDEILNKIIDKLDLQDYKLMTVQNDGEMENKVIDQIESWLFNEE